MEQDESEKLNSTKDRQSRIHATAEVSPQAVIGKGVSIWHQAQLREGCQVGNDCIIGKGVYIDFDVVIGDRVKIQNGCYLYHGSLLEEGVFLGPGVILTNDKVPRAINPDGSLKVDGEWRVGKILVKKGASLGAGVVVLPDITIGKFAMIGAGSVVTRDVPAHGLAVGSPAHLIGFVCYCGQRVNVVEGRATCMHCGMEVSVPNDH